MPSPISHCIGRTSAQVDARSTMASSARPGPRGSVEWKAAPWAAPADSLAASDAKFIAQFEDGSLPFEAWTHAAHLRMATLQLLRHSALDGMPVPPSAPDSASARCSAALRCVVGGIQRYNGAHAAKLSVGFHWTITELWFRMVLLALAEAAASAAAASEAPGGRTGGTSEGRARGGDGSVSFLSLKGSSRVVAAVAEAELATAAAPAGPGAAAATSEAAGTSSSAADSSVPLSSSASMWVLCSRAALFGGDCAARGGWLAPDLRELAPAPAAMRMFPGACGAVTQAGPIVA